MFLAYHHINFHRSDLDFLGEKRCAQHTVRTRQGVWSCQKSNEYETDLMKHLK